MAGRGPSRHGDPAPCDGIDCTDPAPEDAATPLLPLLVPVAARAAEAGGHGTESSHAPSATGTALLFLGIVGLAYLVTHFVVNRLQRRFLFVSGLEYIVLGVLLGPAVVNTLAVFDDLDRLAPIIAFAAGWIGLLYGMEFEVRKLLTEARVGAVRLALADVFGTGTAVTLACWAFFTSGWLVEPVPDREAWAAAGALGCAAAAGSSSAVDLLSDTYRGLDTHLLPLFRRTARIGDLLAIVGLGVLFCLFHPQSQGSVVQAGPADWGMITMGLGLGLGLLFSVFLGRDEDENNRFLAVVGIIVLAAGASFFLQISSLTVNLLLGVVLVNFSASGPQVASTLEGSLKPVTLVLMVFAGAMWTPVPWAAALAICALYVGVRGLAKMLSLLLASLGTPMRRDTFRGLLAQGEVAVAIAIGYRLVYHGPAADLAFTAILVSVMLHEMLAPRLLKGLLIDAGELDSDARSWATEGGA